MAVPRRGPGPLGMCLTQVLYVPTPGSRKRLFPPGLVPDRAVDLLVEGRASRGELAQLVVLGPHQRGAITERAADALAVEAAVLAQLDREVGLGQRCPANADEGDPSLGHIGRPRLAQELLKVAVPRAHHRQVRVGPLNL